MTYQSFDQNELKQLRKKNFKICKCCGYPEAGNTQQKENSLSLLTVRWSLTKETGASRVEDNSGGETDTNGKRDARRGSYRNNWKLVLQWLGASER